MFKVGDTAYFLCHSYDGTNKCYGGVITNLERFADWDKNTYEIEPCYEYNRDGSIVEGSETCAGGREFQLKESVDEVYKRIDYEFEDSVKSFSRMMRTIDDVLEFPLHVNIYDIPEAMEAYKREITRLTGWRFDWEKPLSGDSDDDSLGLQVD